MKHIVFFLVDAVGHVKPTVPIVRELVSRGHRVSYFSHKNLLAKLDVWFSACNSSGRTGCLRTVAYPETESVHGKFVSAVLMLPWIIQKLQCFARDGERPDVIVYDHFAVWGSFLEQMNFMECAYICSIGWAIVPDMQDMDATAGSLDRENLQQQLQAEAAAEPHHLVEQQQEEGKVAPTAPCFKSTAQARSWGQQQLLARHGIKASWRDYIWAFSIRCNLVYNAHEFHPPFCPLQQYFPLQLHHRLLLSAHKMASGSSSNLGRPGVSDVEGKAEVCEQKVDTEVSGGVHSACGSPGGTRDTRDVFRFVGPIVDLSYCSDHSTEPILVRMRELQQHRVGSKLVYISLGTVIAAPVRFWKMCVAAFPDNGEFVVLLSLGAEIETAKDEVAFPPNFVVDSYVPQTAVLQAVDVFVTHGGMNSVMEALLLSVPMVCVPHHGDQPYNSNQVEDCGAGIMIDPFNLTFANLRQAVCSVAQDASFAEEAQKMKAQLEKYKSCELAVDIILS